VKVAVGQLNPIIGDIQGNLRKIKSIIVRARQDGAEFLIFPELAITGYPPRDLLLYDAFLNHVERAVKEEILPLTQGLAVLLGTPWRGEARGVQLFNSALLIKNGSFLSGHHKTLLPNYDVFDERRYFTPAGQRLPAVINGNKVAVTICEDIWNDKDFWERRRYQEDPVEELFRQGAALLVNISASPYHFKKAGQRAKMLCALAGKYKAGVIYVNQVGGNDELIFDGSSMLCSAEGRLLYQARPFQETLFYFDTEDLQDSLRQQGRVEEISLPQEINFSGNLISGMRAEEGINWMYAALQLGLGDYLRKTGFERVVIGLSGGIDSAVTAALAVSTLGPERVLGVLMPSRYSSAHSLEDARALAHNLKIDTIVIPIEEPFSAFLNLMNRGDQPRMDLAEENIQARIRGNVLMFISNREGHLVLTTGNKSELAVGYCTLYGDMSGGLAVLADVPKTMVYQLAGFINDEAGYQLIPRQVIEKAPSAELRPDQKDQDSLPSYEVLDEILHYYIEENKHVEEITALGFDDSLVRDVINKIDRAEYKRFQSAPVLRVTTKAFGSDRRMPLARGYSIIRKPIPKILTG
jgi:NAD+ synthase (glutamine-hydrolysing)